MQETPIALLMGPPGAGKSTVGKLLNNTGLYVHFSMGDVFRSLATGTPDGDLHAKYVKEGKLLPDSMAFRLLMCNLQDLNIKKFSRIVLDGYPRTEQQLISLKQHFAIKAVVALESLEDTLVSRCLLRATQQGRDEERDERVIKKRINSYYELTHPILNSFNPEIVLVIKNNETPLSTTEKIHTFFNAKMTL